MESDTVITHTQCLESRFAAPKTFKGTRSHYEFIPSKNSLIMKRDSNSVSSKGDSLSADENSKLKVSVEDIKFYACMFDNDSYFCNANYVSVGVVMLMSNFYILKVLS